MTRLTTSQRIITVLMGIVVLAAACAPADLDITPSPAPTVEPTATMTPTPLPEGVQSQDDEQLEVLNTILEAVPAQLPAGDVFWRRDFTRGQDGVEALTNITNGIGRRVFYTEQVGGLSNLSFAIFDTPDAAAEHYEFIRSIRNVLSTGREDDSFPTPNLFGVSNQGSSAIFQLDNLFVEVSIEVFSSTGVNPLPALSRQTINLLSDLELVPEE